MSFSLSDLSFDALVSHSDNKLTIIVIISYELIMILNKMKLKKVNFSN